MLKPEIKPSIDSILALVEIMLDEKEFHEVRLEAAEQILAYEAPEEAVKEAKAYLTRVFNNRKLTSPMRLAAIKLMRKSEARRITRASIQSVEGLEGRLQRAHQRLVDLGLRPAGESAGDETEGAGT